ncbi:hypothetical protein LTR49_028095 [Elasticomyces elasticus]|nr:hypothetical protein LTR49_028095 [Elasticomyces elasticus]
MSSTAAAIEIFNPPGYPSLAASYSHVSTVRISPTKRFVSFAGQTATLSTAMPLADQVGAALVNVDKCMAAAGVRKKDIVFNRQYVVKLASLTVEDSQARERCLLEWWRRTEEERLLPPGTLIGVESLAHKEMLFEIEITCIADL